MEDPNNVVRFNDFSSTQITTGDCQVTITPYVTKSFVVFKFFFPDLNGAMDVVVPRDSEVSKGDPELFAREKAPEIRELVLKQMSEEAQEPKEWWRVLVDVREAERKRKMALREDPLDAPGRAEGDKKEEVVVVEPTKKTKSRSKKKSKAKRTVNATGVPEETEQYGDNNVGDPSTRVTSTGNSSPFTFDFEVESHRHRLAIEGTGCSEPTTAASNVNNVGNPQLGGKRHRKGSKSMSQLKANENPMQDNSRDAAVERLKAETLPVSLEVAREKRTTLRRERSGKIQFLRQRTLSRSSSVAGSRPATPPDRDSAPDIDSARLEQVTKAGRPLTSEANVPLLNATLSTSAHKDAFSATEKKWQVVRQQRRKKQQSDQLAAVRPGPAQSKPSRTEKQPKAAAKSPNRDHARINMKGSATASSIITQSKTIDQMVVSPKPAAVIPDPNVRLSYVAAVLKADDNVSHQRLQKADVTTKGNGKKESKNQAHVAAVSPISKPCTTPHAKTSIPDGCLSPQPLQKVEITNIVDLEEPRGQEDVAAASPVRDLQVSHDATTDAPDEKRSRRSPQTLQFTPTIHSSGSSDDQIHITTSPSKSKLDIPQQAKTDSVDQNTPPQRVQTSEIITTIDISGDSKGHTSLTAVSLSPDLKVSHHVIRDIADEYPPSHQQRESQAPNFENTGVSMHQTRQDGETTLITEPGHWLRDEDGRSTDTGILEKAIAAWQDQSDDEMEISTNHQTPSRDPLPYSINNEAYFFRDRPFVVPPQLENEENIQNGTCFPEIPPLLGNPYTGEIPEQVPSTPPLICRCKLHGGSQALINYDSSIHRMIIHPSLHHLPDIRNDPYHPDWLPPFKLAEYQAYEQAGYPVSRFDRVTFECALASCRKVLKDHVRSTLLCNGCGPYTDVRYCSKEHLFEDCKTHWKICGLVPPRVVWDDWSMPARYRRRYPAIKDIRGRRTPERQRQQAYSIHHRASDYVIFSDWKDKQATGQECRGTGKPIVFLLFRDGDPMKDTFNRLLNIAFFDHHHTPTQALLYRLIRSHCRAHRLWTSDLQNALSHQLFHEFFYDPRRLVSERDPCRGDWDGVVDASCSAACRREGAHEGKGLKDWCEGMEARHWILRVWRRECGERVWVRRMMGVGFPGVAEGERRVFKMGEGWEGWGCEEDEICA